MISSPFLRTKPHNKIIPRWSQGGAESGGKSLGGDLANGKYEALKDQHVVSSLFFGQSQFWISGSIPSFFIVIAYKYHSFGRNMNEHQLFPALSLPAKDAEFGPQSFQHQNPIFGWGNLLVMTNSLPWLLRWPIEIDGLPINSMGISMANC
jgi:hypothetical protein